MLRALALSLIAAQPAFAASVAPVRAIRAQTIIAAVDLTVAEEDVPGAVQSVEAAAGLEARVTLYPGRPILASQVGPPAVVERNQVVRMFFSSGALAISAEGRTLDRGGAGDRIRVMNLGSRQVVAGVVSEDGSVEVGQ